MTTRMPKFLPWLAAGALTLGATLAHAADTIKVGVLHSLSGTMAISETTLKDTVLMLVDEQNKKGGLLGKKLEAVVVDPASNWPLFAEKARELLQKEKVDLISKILQLTLFCAVNRAQTGASFTSGVVGPCR